MSECCHHKHNKQVNKLEVKAGKYFCPMCPGVEQDEPGDCPMCGMALERAGYQHEEEDDTELKQLKRRLWICLLLTLPVFISAMGADLLAGIISVRNRQWLEFALSTPVILWGALPFFKKAWTSIVTLHLNMFTLIGLGVTVAWSYSVVAVLFPGIFPGAVRDESGWVAVYFEAAAVITTLVLLGQVFEAQARLRTNTAISQLLNMAAKKARVIREDGTEEEVPVEEVDVGQHLRIRPGEKIPVDGVVIEGKSSVDESMISGESVPVIRQQGDQLFSATINGSGSLVMGAQRVGSETLLAQIVDMVSAAQRSRAPIQKLADIVAGYFVPAVVAIAVITFFTWFFLGPEPQLSYAVINAVAVLIIACPCALGLATPMSIMVGTGKGATSGVLIKNAEALEVMERIDTLVVDKTGTLTEGKPRLVEIKTVEGWSKNDLLQIAASVENHSEHPLATAIMTAAKDKSLALFDVNEFDSITGKGIKGKVNGKAVMIGNQQLTEQDNDGLQDLLDEAESLRQEGQSVIFVLVDDQLAGYFGITDPVKKTTGEAIHQLHKSGLNIVMLTGDNSTTANNVASQLNIDRVIADVSPTDKADIIKQLQQEGRVIAMAGDGINDAPALAQAEVGIAMGTGTDVAMESAGITLVEGDLRGIVRARKLSQATMRNIRQNLFFAFFYNSLGVPVAAGILYPIFGLMLSPMLAAMAMSLSSVSVITNALRLKNAAI